MTLSVDLGSSKSVGQQVCGLCSVEVGSELLPPNYIGSTEVDSVVVVATSELFGNTWKGNLLVESPCNLWEQNEPEIQNKNEDCTGGKLGCDDDNITQSLPLCEVETSTGIGALATVKMGSTNVSDDVVISR